MQMISPPAAASALVALALLAQGGLARGDVVVLNNGRVLNGRITQTTGTVSVRQPGGTTVFSISHVKFIAKNIDDAYDKLAAAIDPDDAEAHLEMASWCLGQLLLDRGRVHLALARRELSKDDPRVERLKTAFEEAHRRTFLESTPPPPIDNEALAASVHGLSTKTVQTFVIRVQPILQNGCANARCHAASSQQEFVLQPTRPGRNDRGRNLANLTALVDRINGGPEALDDFLEYAAKPHGGTRQPPLAGRYLVEQQSNLREWMRAAAGELEAASAPQASLKSKPPIAAEPRETSSPPPTADAFDPERFNLKK